MALDYSKRGLWSVHVHGFQVADVKGAEGAGTGVTIILTSEADPSLPGPKIQLDFAFPASTDLTLRQLQDEALAAAAALLQRFGRETKESLRAAAAKDLRESLVPDPA